MHKVGVRFRCKYSSLYVVVEDGMCVDARGCARVPRAFLWCLRAFDVPVIHDISVVVDDDVVVGVVVGSLWTVIMYQREQTSCLFTFKRSSCFSCVCSSSRSLTTFFFSSLFCAKASVRKLLSNSHADCTYLPFGTLLPRVLSVQRIGQNQIDGNTHVHVCTHPIFNCTNSRSLHIYHISLTKQVHLLVCVLALLCG